MTALGIVLLVLGATLLVVETHVPSLGALGVPGLAALVVGAVLAVSGLGGGAGLVIAVAVMLGLAGAGLLAVVVPKSLAARRRSIGTGPERLIGRVGEVRSWNGAGGQVLVDGALWRAKRSWAEDEQSEPLHPGDHIVVERLKGLTLTVRRAEDWELVE